MNPNRERSWVGTASSTTPSPSKSPASPISRFREPMLWERNPETAATTFNSSPSRRKNSATPPMWGVSTSTISISPPGPKGAAANWCRQRDPLPTAGPAAIWFPRSSNTSRRAPLSALLAVTMISLVPSPFKSVQMADIPSITSPVNSTADSIVSSGAARTRVKPPASISSPKTPWG